MPSAGLRIGKNRHGERTFFSENWPDQAHRWLPTVDHPSDKATSEFFVTAPARYQVVSNGLLQEETDLGDGRRLTHWKQSVPIASWLNALGVAQFASHHAGTGQGDPARDLGLPPGPRRRRPRPRRPRPSGARVLLRAHRPVPLREARRRAGRGAERRHGARQRDLLRRAECLGRGVDRLVAHEVAHQWFGDSVTERDWDDVWLSEGFATYFALLFLEHDSGRDAFVAGLKRSREIVFATEKRNPGLAVIHDNLADMRKVLNRLVYQKGGWMLHMLRGQLGTETFWAGIREYYRAIATATPPPTTSAA